MGAVAGIVHWTGAPIDPVDLERIARASDWRRPDGWGSAMFDRAALAHLRFTTSDTGDGAQPLVDQTRGIALVFDGRLDNRDDLAEILGRERLDSDARFALEAFARWGAGAAAHLLGDFSFIAYDARVRRAVCARDHFGIRHLHYHAGRRRLICATDVAQVLAHPEVPREPDTAVIADLLAGDVRNGPGTLFRHVRRVPPGHVLVADGRGVRLERYWSPEPGRPVRHRDDRGYAEECREILVRSVGARMRSDRPTAALLSGGLDSSSVVTVAHRIAEDAGPPPRPFSMIFPDRPESDERPFIDAVARSCEVTPVLIRPERITGGALRRQARAFADSPGMPADESLTPAWRSMREHGHRVALTGAGGDFLFSGSMFHYADLIRRGRVVAAVRDFIADWRDPDLCGPPLSLLQAGVWPLLPLSVKDAVRPIARRAARVRGQPAWLRIARQPEAHPVRPRGGSYATEDVTRQLGCGMHAYFLETGERVAARSGIEVRHPLLDKRLIEFALNIPDDQRKRGRYTKYVLRTALDGHLAEEVRTRRSKGDFAHTIADALEAIGPDVFAGLRIADAGWVDGPAISAEYRRMRERYAAGDATYGHLVPGLWMVAAVELWFRSAFDRCAVPETL